MIPPFNTSGTLPPFTGKDSIDRLGVSPYEATISEVVKRFFTSEERRVILKGLLAYRSAQRAVGIASGYQWLDGSFVEDVENIRSRPPGDIDIVTYAYRPTLDQLQWVKLVNDNTFLFDATQTKAQFKVDAYYVDLNIPGHLIVMDTAYWYGVFAHDRRRGLWKGMVKVDLLSDDDVASDLLDKTNLNAQGASPQIAHGEVDDAETA